MFDRFGPTKTAVQPAESAAASEDRQFRPVGHQDQRAALPGDPCAGRFQFGLQFGGQSLGLFRIPCQRPIGR